MQQSVLSPFQPTPTYDQPNHCTLEIDVDQSVLGVGFVLYDTTTGRVYDDNGVPFAVELGAVATPRRPLSRRTGAGSGRDGVAAAKKAAERALFAVSQAEAAAQGLHRAVDEVSSPSLAFDYLPGPARELTVEELPREHTPNGSPA